MAFEVEYFHERVLAEIESWPVDVLADCARLVELLLEYGSALRLPHSRALGDGLFELRPHGRSGIGRALTASSLASESPCYMRSSKRLNKRRIET
jgi:hypothetical protein